MKGYAIKEVADATGIQAGTIRMWEQRYGFPEPARTGSGYRVYSHDDIDALRRVVAFRARGLSVPAALERARSVVSMSDRPSLFAAILSTGSPVPTHVLRKPALLAMSRAIEDETLARAARPVVVAAFQRAHHYRPVEHRYRRLATMADATLVFADFAEKRIGAGRPCELPIEADAVLGHEWAVVVDAPGYAACLVGWEQPESESDPSLSDRERRFEVLWTLDPDVVRRAARAGAALAGGIDAELGERIEGLLSDRPLALESPAPALTALTNRMLAYLEKTPAI